MEGAALSPSPIWERGRGEGVAVETGPAEYPHPQPLSRTGEGSLLRFITCGSVDDGKSTLIGRLIYETGSVPEDQLATLHKDSRKFGTQGERLDFALLVDGLSAEREQGITIDVAYRYFHTQKRSFIVADTPGHEQYTRNMATGASTAELAIILIDARKGVLPQTRRHSLITSMLGVRHAVIAINKMDLVGYSREVFDKIASDYREMAKALAFSSLIFVPVSALEGDNIAAASAAMPWYEGPSLLAQLEHVRINEASGDRPFRMPVQWVNRPTHDFRGFSGTIASGRIKPGETIIARPNGQKALISRIVTFDSDLAEAFQGQAVTLVLDREIDVSRGDCLVAVSDTVLPRQKADAHLFWMSEKAMLEGGRFLIKMASSEAEAKIETLHHVLDIHSFAKTAKSVLAMNGIGQVRLSFDKPMLVAPYSQDKTLGAFILIDRLTNETVALGLIDAFAETKAETAPQHNLLHWLGIREEPWKLNLAKAVLWRGLAALLLGLAAFSLSGQLWLALVLAFGDALLRPVLRRVYERIWSQLQARLAARSERAAENEGSGI